MAFRTLLPSIIAVFALGLVASPASPARAQGTLTVTYTTQPHGGNYAPRNVVVVWVEDAGGTFVRTVDRWAANRRQHLVAWTQKAGAGDADAVSGATRSNHTAPLTKTWDLTNKLGQPVPDGTYTIRMELADSNATQAAQNAQGTFTFVKNGTASTQTGLTSGGFTNVTIAYTPAAPPPPNCGNGTLDTGETCDPVASCPTTCAATGDACAVNTLVGSASSCTAACEIQEITACGADDGCCPTGCTESNDGDCEPGGAVDNPDITGGCATGGPSPAPLALGALLALLVTRRRRRARAGA